jgi:uncharacterized protein
LKKSFYKPLGLTFLLLGAAGIVLPVLPSTPFVLLAAWFFARSSPEWHERLLRSELFGNMIRNWDSRRCISLRTKLIALLSMLAAGTGSILFAMESTTLRVGTAILLGIGGLVVLSIETCKDCAEDASLSASSPIVDE